MPSLFSYKRFNALIEQETFEPLFSWGMRMAVAATVPVIWGLKTGNMEAASWITLTAECICWVELKGSFGQRIRVLCAGITLTILFAILGSLTGTNVWLSVGCMLGVGFVSGLFKNLGDRGSGLAICVYVMFIIAAAYPTITVPELKERSSLILIGGLWNALVGIIASVFMPAKQPYRRTVAVICRSIAALIETIGHGWDDKTVRSSIRDIYLKEQEVRSAIDNSLHFYTTMAHQANKKDKHEYELAHVRKATALLSAHVIAIIEELERVSIHELPMSLRLKTDAMFKALRETVERLAVFIVTLKPEEELLLSSRISRLNKVLILLKEYDDYTNEEQATLFKRVIHLAERSVRIIESSVTRLESVGEDLPVYRSYSLIKTVFILHPKHWLRNLQLLFNFNTFTVKYAIRTAIAATVAMFFYKWYHIDHGYWLPFTVIIVSQPYFGATFKKAIDRVLGTVLGGLAGGLFLNMPTGLYLKEIVLFVSFVMMVYFIRKRYSVAAFFITLSLVLLFDVEDALNPMLIIIRASVTVGGAVLAIIAGFALLPHWDKKWLPVNLAGAVAKNYTYFIYSFFPAKTPSSWTRLKRLAESANSNAFDSFNRYMEEPGFRKKPYAVYFHIITHNVRITRELNNINIEQEAKTDAHKVSVQANSVQRLNMCIYWFKQNMIAASKIAPDERIPELDIVPGEVIPRELTTQQVLYLDRMIIELKAMHKDIEQLASQSED